MIGGKCKRSNALSLAVLMAEGLLRDAENQELFRFFAARNLTTNDLFIVPQHFQQLIL